MQIKTYDFDNLPFGNLFSTYIKDFSALSEFYETNPFDLQRLKNRAQALNFAGDRDRSAEILHNFNQGFDLPKESPVFNNIERLRHDDALVIVTGQQLGLYGGPLFTMFKTLTALHQAAVLEEELQQPVVPVFWLADEDHDYAEVREVKVLNEKKVKTFSLPPKSKDLPPVSELRYPEEIKSVTQSLRETLIETGYSEEVWELLDECFVPGKSFRSGFGTFIARLFSKHGLVLAGSHISAVKQETKETLKSAVKDADSIREALDHQSQKIKDQFHEQVKLYDSHLFYLDRDNGRVKLSRNGTQWEAANGQCWSQEELLNHIDEHPERFSPDVFLRPILQDRLLPTLGYVAGPGETAYYGQMKSFYQCFGLRMPAIIPRLSGSFIEPAIDRILGELPFALHEYNNRLEDLETEFVNRTEEADINSLFKEWEQQIKRVSEPFVSQLKEIDKTLTGAAGKAHAAVENEQEELKKKVYRAVKKRETIQVRRIRRIQQNLFPERNLQERTLCGIYFMNKFGLDIWDRLLDSFRDSGSIQQHNLIYL